MPNKLAEELRTKIKGGSELTYLDTLDKPQLEVFKNGLAAASQREQQALDQAIEHSMALVPFLLRGAFKKILFP